MEKQLFSNRYADKRIVQTKSTTIVVKNGTVEQVVESVDNVISYRVINTSIGFSSTNRTSTRDVWKKAVALSYGGNKPKTLAPAPVKEDERVIKPSLSPLDISLDEKVAIAKQIEKELRVSPLITTTHVTYADAFVTKVFENTEGSRIVQTYPVVTVRVLVVAKEGGVIQRAVQGFSGHFGVEKLKHFEPARVGERAVAMLKSVPVKAGKYTVIVDGKMAGVFAHEAVGHACEADTVLDGDSILENKLGMRIGSPLVSIIDDATKVEWNGGFFYDDEGVRAQKKWLVKDGVLTSYLHSRETAAIFGVRSTGNYRGKGGSLPLVRMSNTTFARGDFSREELFDIREGLYVKGMLGGAVVPASGEFVFTAEEGFIIRRGEEDRRVRNIMLVGNILHTLKHVDAVGKDFETSPGTCGKEGKSVPVADGGPHLRIRNIFVSGATE